MAAAQPPAPGAPAGAGALLRTAFYIDGFNLFHRALEDGPYRWLDLDAMARALIDPTKHSLVAVNYFTARVKPMAGHPNGVNLQKLYLKAHQAYRPHVRMVFGRFQVHDKAIPPLGSQPSMHQLKIGAPAGKYVISPTMSIDQRVLSYPPPAGGPAPAGDVVLNQRVLFQRREEKGTDVNLAVHMVNEAWLDLYDMAVVVSNDADLIPAMNMIRQKGKRVGVVYPLVLAGGTTSTDIVNFRPDFQITLRAAILAGAQLPSPIPGTGLTKPASW